MDTENRLTPVAIDGFDSPLRSAVASPASCHGVPAVFVHGIFENIWKWLTPAEAAAHGFALPDHRLAAPRFEFSVDAGLPIQVSRPMAEVGLLESCSRAALPVLAYSYQDLAEPVAPMAKAVEAVHRAALFAMERWRTDRIQLVGHSRGGLVCRHALIRDSAALRASEFRRHVHRLTTIATPHRGSRLAEGLQTIDRAIDRFETFRDRLVSLSPVFAAAASAVRPWKPLRMLRDSIAHLAQLTPDSEEVRGAASERMPDLPGGYFAVAGESTVYFRCDLPMLRSFRFPPAFPIPELTDGLGDIAVAVHSAWDIPHATAANRVRIGVNHFTNTFDLRVHQAVIDWIA